MTKKIIIKQLNWQEVETSTPPPTLYHDLRWLKIIQNSFGHKASVLTALDADLQLAYLPLVELRNPIFGNSLISLPFLNGGGVFFNNVSWLAPKDSDDNLSNFAIQEELFKAISRALDGYDYFELRLNSNELTTHPVFVCRDHKVTFVLDLKPNPEEQFEQFSKKLKSQIKRPEKSSANCRLLYGAEIQPADQNLFYQVLAKHWRDLGSPIYPKKFFDLVFSEFREQILLSFVELDNKVCSVGLTIIHGQQAEICWAASLKEYKHASPNMLLYWSTIEKLCQLGIKKFDFGRCTKDSGTYNFKKQWGGNEVQLYWYYLKTSKKIPNISADNPKFKLAVKVWKLLPVKIATLLGSKVSKYFP